MKYNWAKDFTIRRSTWFRGEMTWQSDGERERCFSVLLRPSCTPGDQHSQCCVGLWATASGMRASQLRGSSTLLDAIGSRGLDTLNLYLNPEHSSHVPYVGEVAADLYAHNDSRDLTPQDRERLIKESFAKVGVKVTFID